jgi:phosphopantothenoylcysteine decarboxylase/phosphopantothenate--cysteine ligase
VITAGPTYEPLDNVRRLTNFSTGRLGTELANHLVKGGHTVDLLLGEHATYRGQCLANHIEEFSTTSDLEQRFIKRTNAGIDAIFHAAAVSDFKFGKVWLRSEAGQLTEAHAGKISTRKGTLLAELVPTAKIISQLRKWFPASRIIGWKFEVDGDRAQVLELGRTQMAECRTDACVVNGPAYGPGFAIVRAGAEPQHCASQEELFSGLSEYLQRRFAR